VVLFKALVYEPFVFLILAKNCILKQLSIDRLSEEAKGLALLNSGEFGFLMLRGKILSFNLPSEALCEVILVELFEWRLAC